jgi:hypothetical protein
MIKLGGLIKEALGKPGQVIPNPYARAFAPIKEADEDHEVKMAQGQLDYIIKTANELKGKLGNAEKNIPGWIQDHISKAHSYLHQSNSGYHEYNGGMNEEAPCWKGYQQIGMKDKDGRQVPNCVPNESVVNESDYNFGSMEYTLKNMTPSQIQDLALAYQQANITRITGKTMDGRIRASRDLGRLVGRNPIKPDEKSKEPALLLQLYKSKLISLDDYKKLYNELLTKLKSVNAKYILKYDPAGRNDKTLDKVLAKAAARADMRQDFNYRR